VTTQLQLINITIIIIIIIIIILPPNSPASQQLTTGQTTVGSGTQLDLLMMGIKMSETCSDTIDYQ